MSSVFLVWDHTRAEHGELPTLVDVYATHALAAGRVSEELEGMYDDPHYDSGEVDFTINERKVID